MRHYTYDQQPLRGAPARPPVEQRANALSTGFGIQGVPVPQTQRQSQAAQLPATGQVTPSQSQAAGQYQATQRLPAEQLRSVTPSTTSQVHDPSVQFPSAPRTSQQVPTTPPQGVAPVFEPTHQQGVTSQIGAPTSIAGQWDTGNAVGFTPRGHALWATAGLGNRRAGRACCRGSAGVRRWRVRDDGPGRLWCGRYQRGDG